jgi:hypothetical protein
LRIEGANRVAVAYEGGGVRRGSGAGFALPSDGAARPAATEAVHAPPSLDALLMLQEVPPAAERRRRALKRGRSLLDLLEELRLSLLGGALPAALPGRLGALLAETRDATDDGGLDALLDAVDLRAAVELAKIGRSVSPES